MSQSKESATKLEGTAGSENPKYVMMWTNEELLSMLAYSLSGDETMKSMMPLPASSTVIIELYSVDNSGTPELMVDLFVNDQQVIPTFCGGTNQSCTAQDFMTALSTSVKVTDTAATCSN